MFLALTMLAAAGMFFYSVPALIPKDVARFLLPGVIPVLTATQTPATSTPDLSTLPTGTLAEASLTQVAATTPSRTQSSTAVPTPSTTPTPTSTPMGGAGLIAFASNRGGTPPIYLMNFDGSDQRPITNEVEGACQPSWSPDGKRLAYISPCSRRSPQDAL